MAQLEELILERTATQGQLNRFVKFVNDFEANNGDFSQLEARMSRAESLLQLFDNIQSKIEKLEQSVDEQIRADFEDLFFQVTSTARALIAGADVNNIQVAYAGSTQSERSNSNLGGQVRLPTLNLPTFDGTYDQWLFFKDTFTSIIHDDGGLSNIQKFHYLRLSLKGKAAEVIQALEISASNYKIAWELLLDRFENRNLLISNHIKAFLNLPILQKESLSGLRDLLDGFNKHLRALEILDQPVDQWDTLVIHIIAGKVDPITRREWEVRNAQLENPSLSELRNLLKDKCRILETLRSSTNNSVTSELVKPQHSRHKIRSFVQCDNKCSICDSPHLIYNCGTFLKLSPEDRYARARQRNLCVNCLKPNHNVSQCRRNGCKKCHKRHNILLHFEIDRKGDVASTNNPAVENRAGDNAEQHKAPNIMQALTSYRFANNAEVILSTAIIRVLQSRARCSEARALLDSGSQSHFITEELVNSLGLPKFETKVSVSGINQAHTSINYYTRLTIGSRFNAFSTTITCLIVPCIAASVPGMSFDPRSLNIPANLELADPLFYESRNVDLLIGADLFWTLLCNGQVRSGKTSPILHKTRLGWILAGEIPGSSVGNQNCSLICKLATQNLEESVAKFWELEQVNESGKYLNNEEKSVESHFVAHTARAKDGRFIVNYPLVDSPETLGDSREIALKRFFGMERKLYRNDMLRSRYSNFMKDYIDLGHMTLIKEEDRSLPSYYIPHHYVLKESSVTTKLRVVFDASAKTDNGLSFNDLQMNGPTIQHDLLSIVLRFRKYNVVLTADITKMYRMIWVHPDQRNLQRIFWRSDREHEVSCYALNTVTYGMKAASFLATRCLYQLACDFAKRYPKACKCIQNDFYVDDLLTGGDNIEEVEQLQREVSSVLESGGFHLNKWLSNSDVVLQTIVASASDAILNIGDNNETKTLGLCWESKSDSLYYTVSTSVNKRITKRSVLSELSQLFDPLGLLSPIIITGKIILQSLWQQKLSWDESIPLALHTRWQEFRQNLVYLNNIRIPRHVIVENPISVELHGYADASEIAYGAVVYIRSTDNMGNVVARILTSKSKVAPLRTLSIPRLELCGALLLARLMNKVKNSMDIPFAHHFYWCDSTIVLAWLRSESRTFKTFVSNRISEIQSLSEDGTWRHVRSSDNPADLISRGENSKTLLSNTLWWSGPAWLCNTPENWPTGPQLTNSELPTEEIKVANNISLPVQCDQLDIIGRYSSLPRLQRVVAHVLRFVNNARNVAERQSGPLSLKELQAAMNCLFKISQRQDFSSELRELRNSREVNSKSKLVALNPFLDTNGLIRVGGRLSLSNFDYDRKHPVVLSGKHPLTNLLAKNEHVRLLHAGPQALLASLRNKHWIISGRNLVRKVVHNCVRCFRCKPTDSTYLMGSLPTARLTPTRPFKVCGIDYAGPILIRDRKTRNYKTTKVYICLFICFVTKAVHIELVSELTSDAFIAALRRFVSRRGKCSDIYSDNASNFVGADKIIRDFLRANKNTIHTNLAMDGIQWHFIPARAPHFGGLWEAGIRGVKYHLKRVVGDAALTFEELYTTLTQIEACINSRPLHPMSIDPNDTLPITPAHFLIGDTLVSVPDGNYNEAPAATLSRFKRAQQLMQHFWRRWSQNYVTELQTRSKWRKNGPTLLAVDTLVIIKDETSPPLRWKLGRVIEVHPGPDGVVRAVTVRTSTGVVKRPVSKLCVLPNGGDATSS